MSEQLIPTPGVFGENGNFLLERELGAGGMGGVYMGRDKMLDRPVAVKVMLKEYGADAEFVEKFKREAQAAAKLIHPNIAQIYSYGICDGMPYIAMELVAGGSLWSIMENGGGHTDVPRVMKICQQVAQALQCASDQGYVHGDVKPENILLDANGNAKLVDFGLAAMQKNSDEIWGTPYYISPERVRKEQVDYRADMYSLGGTLYHALTGVPPFDGDDSIAVVKKRFEGAPKKPSEIRRDLTPAIDKLVMKMLAVDKADRFPSFEALLQAFKEVLTTGLTQQISEAAGKSDKPKTAGRRVLVRGRTGVAMRRSGMTVRKNPSDSDAPASDVSPDVPNLPDADEEDEKGGNLGLKVAIFVIGGLLVIGGVIGGLVWFKVSSEAAREAEAQAEIQKGYSTAKSAIEDTVSKASKFADEFDSFAQRAIEACEKPTEELIKILPEDQGKMLKPQPTKELLDAIASTNEVVAAAVPAPQPQPAVTNAAPTNVVAKAAAATNAPAAKATGKEAKPAKPAETKESAPKEEVPQVVLNMNELWERAYGCQASAVRLRHAIRQVIKKAGEAAAFSSPTRENMEKLAELSRQVVDMFEQVKVSKDVENVRKGITYIKTKGEKLVEQTVKRLRIEKLEKERKDKAEAQAKAEKERKEKAEAEHKELVEGECNSIKEKFESIVSQGNFRLLDWKGAIRQLEVVKAEFTTAEGQLAADVQIRKVQAMKAVHDIFIKNGRDFSFKGKLKGATITGATESELQLSRGGKTFKITWQKFYKNFPGNLNELIKQFVVNGRKNCRPALNLKDWSNAMTGAALTLQIICSEVNGAAERSVQLAKDAVKQFPEYATIAKEIFPDIKFEVEEE